MIREEKLLMWTEGLPLDAKALEQARQTASMPFVWPHLALMPDYHYGLGATVGSVVPTLGVVIPGAVGVDIGCGMQAVQTNLTKDQIDPEGLYERISAAIPHGRTCDGQEGDVGAWKEVPEEVRVSWSTLSRPEFFFNRHPRLVHPFAERQLGTLGTGNHFIEVSLDENDRVWAVLHSGSRGPGARIGSYFVKLAKELMKRFHITLPNPDLAYLPEGEPLFDEYWAAVCWAQRYAKANRALMMDRVLKALGDPQTPQYIDCHHNYVARERHFGKDLLITRKGAVSAQLGEWGIIPGSMGARTFITQGMGDRASICSSSHGAGRIMSRTEAEKSFTVADHIRDTEGIVCDKTAAVLDETPKAYKNIDAVMAAQADLVEVVHTLRQVVSVKGGKDPEARR